MTELLLKRQSYPRVSEIIGKQNAEELRSIPLDVLTHATERGTAIHTYCTAWVRNLWVAQVEPEYEPYFRAFIDWAALHIEAVSETALRLYDDEKMFTGELDMIVKMRGTDKVMILDIKTSANKSKAWPLQLAAYAHLCKVNGYQFDGVLNVHLKKESKKGSASYPLVKAVALEYDDVTPYWDIFASALSCYNYFNRRSRA